MDLFITFEGGDGSGKTSQTQILYQRLTNLGYSVKLTHEPGGTALSEIVREILHGRKRGTSLAREVYSLWFQEQAGPELHPLTELFLFEAARAQLVAEVVRPQLDSGNVVICDRFTDSTLAYQGYGRGLDLDLIRNVNLAASQGLRPDLTVLLDVPTRVGLNRKKGGLGLDRIEKEEAAFHERVRQGFLEIARSEPDRWLIVNADQPEETISEAIWQRVETILSKKE